MNALAVLPAKQSAVDYTLLISRIEQEIIQGSDPERCQRILGQQRIRESLGPELQLQLAHLA
jgi:hypothetical protein